jgi:hypothetical protein
MRHLPASGWVRGARSGGQGGLALVVVLWVLVLLALMAASFTRTTRTEVNITRNLIDNAEAEALADAGVYRAVLALLDPDPAQRPRRDGNDRSPSRPSTGPNPDRCGGTAVGQPVACPWGTSGLRSLSRGRGLDSFLTTIAARHHDPEQ